MGIVRTVLAAIFLLGVGCFIGLNGKESYKYDTAAGLIMVTGCVCALLLVGSFIPDVVGMIGMR